MEHYEYPNLKILLHENGHTASFSRTRTRTRTRVRVRVRVRVRACVYIRAHIMRAYARDIRPPSAEGGRGLPLTLLHHRE